MKSRKVANTVPSSLRQSDVTDLDVLGWYWLPHRAWLNLVSSATGTNDSLLERYVFYECVKIIFNSYVYRDSETWDSVMTHFPSLQAHTLKSIILDQ